MVNKPVNRKRALVALEMALMGFLCWVVLSGLLMGPVNNAQASPNGVERQDPKQTKKERRQARKRERWVPEEGRPQAISSRLVAAIGTPGGTTTCTGGFNFETGAQGFTVEPVQGAALWHVTNNQCRASLPGHSVPFTFYYGQDATCNYNTGARNASNLISPPISLVGTFAPFAIGFNYLLFVEGGGFDTTFVDISTNNGATWTQLLSKANLINDNQWHSIAVDVTAQVGSATSIRLRFRFDSIDNIANSTTGWHVDDVAVCGQQFNFCVQDDLSGDFIQLNSVTGAYTSRQCSTGFTVSGTGTVTTNGCFVTLQQFTNSRFNSVTVDTCNNTATGAIRVVNGLSIVTYFISDSNTLNNTCACP